MKIKVLRAFYWEGQVKPVGSVFEVSERQAAELASMGKAERAADEPAPAPPGPLTTDSAADLLGGKRGKKDVQP